MKSQVSVFRYIFFPRPESFLWPWSYGSESVCLSEPLCGLSSLPEEALSAEGTQASSCLGPVIGCPAPHARSSKALPSALAGLTQPLSLRGAVISPGNPFLMGFQKGTVPPAQVLTGSHIPSFSSHSTRPVNPQCIRCESLLRSLRSGHVAVASRSCFCVMILPIDQTPGGQGLGASHYIPLALCMS